MELTFTIDQLSTIVAKTVDQVCQGIGYVSAHLEGQTLIGTNPNVTKTSFDFTTDSYVGGALPPAPTTSLAIVGSVRDDVLFYSPRSVVVSGQYAYVTAYLGSRLTIVDISNPGSPTIVGSIQNYTNLYGARYVFVSGQYAYVTAFNGNALTIVDVSNPASPTVFGSVQDDTNLRFAESVYVSGQYAYVAVSDTSVVTGNRLTVVDVSNPASPTVVGSVKDDANLRGAISVFVSGQYAYVAAYRNNRLTVVDVSNPASPTVVGSVKDDTNLRSARSVFVSGQYAYVTAPESNALTVVDVSNPASPTVIGSVRDNTNLNGARSVYISGQYAYVAAYLGHRLTVVNISNPANPAVVSSVYDATKLEGSISVFVSGQYAYVAGLRQVLWENSHLTIVDVSNPVGLFVAGSANDGTNLNNPNSVFVSGQYAYVTAYTGNRLTVVDVSNPSSPAVVGSVYDATNLYRARSVFVSGRYAYVAAFLGNRLTVVDVLNPASPTVVGSVYEATKTDSPLSVFVSGRYAYLIARQGKRLTVVDVINPTSPTVVSSSTIPNTLVSSSASIFVSGRYTYMVIDTILGHHFFVADVSNPLSPTVVASFRDIPNLNGVRSVFVSGRYAYVAAGGNNRLTVVDVSNPVSPQVVSSVYDATNLNNAASVFVSGRYAYVAAQNGNRLTVVDVSNPVSPTVVGSINDATNLDGAVSVFVSGRYAYVAAYAGNRLTVVDLGPWIEASTSGTWQKILPNTEADSYLLSLTPLQQYDLAGTIPLLPVNLLPNSSQDVTLVLSAKTTHHLRVAVRDSETRLPLSGAQVEIRKGASVQTRETGKGYFVQTDWSGGSGQSVYGNLTRYWSDDGHVDVNSSPGLVKLRPNQPEGTLISSTIDFGQPINPANILWNQTVQPSEGVSVTFQIATNNDNATWNFLGPDGTANTVYSSSGTSIHPVHNGSRYLRYKFTLTDPAKIYDVAVTFTEGCAPPGQAYFADLSEGQYTLTVTRSGYQTFNGSVGVTGETVFEVVLNP